MGTLHVGVHGPLERVADELIMASLAGVTSQGAKSDILTPWKEQARRSREVFSRTGVVDAAVRRGVYHRAANPQYPHLNSRDGVAPPMKMLGAGCSDNDDNGTAFYLG